MSTFPDEAFLAAVPVQALASESGAGGNLVLLRPKILSPRWSWLLGMMKKPVYRVKLDARGTVVWQACDGARSVDAIVRLLSERYPEEEDVLPRTALFIRELARGRFLRLEAAAPPLDPLS
jgi:hypothetical protein